MAVIIEELSAEINAVGKLSATINNTDTLSATLASATSVYENDYELLINQPNINGVKLIGDKSFEDLGENTMGALDVINVFNAVWN